MLAGPARAGVGIGAAVVVVLADGENDDEEAVWSAAAGPWVPRVYMAWSAGAHGAASSDWYQAKKSEAYSWVE